jgi:hypothetical protein
MSVSDRGDHTPSFDVENDPTNEPDYERRKKDVQRNRDGLAKQGASDRRKDSRRKATGRSSIQSVRDQFGALVVSCVRHVEPLLALANVLNVRLKYNTNAIKSAMTSSQAAALYRAGAGPSTVYFI